MSRLFGWSYPPGCSGPPDYEGPCDVCGLGTDNCICPECKQCGAYGDPLCYEKHGMVKTPEQIASRAKAEAEWLADGQAVAEAEERMMREIEKGMK